MPQWRSLLGALVAIVLGVPACCRPGAAERPYTAAELEAEERVQLARAGAGYTSTVVSPFVVIGNGPASAVRDDAAQTVAWARDLLKRDYFARDPGSIVSIWVFRDEGSYRSGVSALFGPWSMDTPSMPSRAHLHPATLAGWPSSPTTTRESGCSSSRRTGASSSGRPADRSTTSDTWITSRCRP